MTDFLHSDSASIDPNDDELGYKNFSLETAKRIVRINADDGFVVAITGEWGCGKTTTLNYIEYFLTKEQEKVTQNCDTIPVIFHFNPWLFSGHQDIIFQFFSQLYSEFNQKKIDLDNLTPIFEKLFEFGSLLAVVSTPPGFIVGGTFKLLQILSKKKDKKTIEKILHLREELIHLLKNQNKKILVIIDDSDRLTANEIQDLFRSLKAVSNFPNIIYLLAYDNTVIEKGLETKTQGCIVSEGKGRDYLEKIVQLSLPLPPPRQADLENFFQKHITNAIGDFNPNYYDAVHWLWVFKGGIDHVINSPRKVKRLANSIKVDYSSVKDEVNVVDFIGIEVLKLHQPAIYQKIRDNWFILLKDFRDSFDTSLEKPDSIEKPFYADLLQSIDGNDKKAVIRIILNLFPECQQYLDPEKKTLHYDNCDIKKARICSNKEVFFRYFRFELSEFDYSNQEISRILSIENCEVLRKLFSDQFDKKNSDGSSRLSPLLDFLKNHIDSSVSRKVLICLINTLVKIEDRILSQSDNSGKMFGPQNILDRILFLFLKCWELIPAKDRADVVHSAFIDGTSIPLLTKILARVSIEHGYYRNTPSNNPSISKENLESLEKAYLKKIPEQYPDQIQFFSSPNVQDTLVVWNHIPGCSDIVKKYVESFFNNEKAIIEAITQSQKKNIINPIQTKSLNLFIDEITFRSKIEKILENKKKLSMDEENALSNILAAKSR